MMRAESFDAPIARRPLAEELAERLREAIVEGDMGPGARIAEKALCERFGVSRTPLREALKVLAREGLVTLTPNRGAAVAELTMDDLEEAFPIMGALEALAGELACARATDAEIAALRDLHDAMAAARGRGARAEYLALNDRFHAGLAAAARNRTLAETQASLDRRIRRGRRRASVSEARWTQAIAEHAQIVAALEARDAARLSALLRLHMENKLAALKVMAQATDAREGAA
ncbi:GntR family transcriptional regulator [Rubrimonas sp.]|uniref:GntR family transcriptional regulator n=1 Tax=Rubrimonas sp. TaxID=2036015 RepID=UPI002FDCEB3F